MHERQIEERPQYFFGRFVETASERPVGDGSRQRIGREGTCTAAKHVSWKLVEQNDEGKRILGVIVRCCELSARGGFVQREEP
jgi:hypothetical protein